MNNFVIDIFSQLVVAAITFVLGLAISKIPRSWDNYRLRQLFGEDFFTENFKVVYGVFTRVPQLEKKKPVAAYQKVYSNQTTKELRAPFRITTEATLRGLSYFLQEFSKYRKKPFEIRLDEEVLSSHNSTFMCMGGPLSNEITDLALQDNNNKFLKFVVPESFVGDYATIESPSESINFSRKDEAGQDYGIIVKVRNSRSPQKYYFVCAGIGAMGSSASLWYLANNWKQLYKEFGSKEFGIVIEVTRSQDSTTRRVHGVSKV